MSQLILQSFFRFSYIIGSSLTSPGEPPMHPGNKSEHMLHLLCHQGPLEVICLLQDSNHVFLWPGYHLHHDTTKHGNFGVVKVDWHSVVFIHESRFCLNVSDGHTYVWHRPGACHLLECICPRHTGTTSGFKMWGAISYNSRSDLAFL